jgi:CBS domain-containing membrane protein
VTPEIPDACLGLARLLELSDEDIVAAMGEVQGYLDITPGDFREIYHFAYGHAVGRLTNRVRAREIMTRDVIAVANDAALPEVASLMAQHGVSGVPVIDAGRRVVGVISEKDFLARMGASKTGSFMEVVADCLESKGCVAVPIRQECAAEVMTTPPITAGEDARLCEITTLLGQKGINRVPVVDGAGRLVGIITRTDVVHGLFPEA